MSEMRHRPGTTAADNARFAENLEGRPEDVADIFSASAMSFPSGVGGKSAGLGLSLR